VVGFEILNIIEILNKILLKVYFFLKNLNNVDYNFYLLGYIKIKILIK